MKMNLLYLTLFSYSICLSQSNISTVNSGSIISPTSQLSIGEIFINPVNENQTSSGIIGILAQVNQQTLEVQELDLTASIKVYPNPTAAKIYLQTTENLQGEVVSIYNNVGQLVIQTKVASDYSIDLEDLAVGIYIIKLSNKHYNSFKIIKR